MLSWRICLRRQGIEPPAKRRIQGHRNDHIIVPGLFGPGLDPAKPAGTAGERSVGIFWVRSWNRGS